MSPSIPLLLGLLGLTVVESAVAINTSTTRAETRTKGTTTTTPSGAWRPRFSWETLPVFFHAQNTSLGAFNPAALERLARFPLATIGMSGMLLPNGTKVSMEVSAPETCRQISAASQGKTHTFSYVNSVIDWPWNYQLHADMVANPDWRAKEDNGSDWRVVGGNWVYNLSNPAMRKRWIQECVDATQQGCTGCFIDQSNAAEGFVGKSPAAKQYSLDHLATLVELSETLETLDNGTHYVINNHLGNAGDHVHMMMIEDFVGTETCVRMLQTISSRGIAIEAHAGNAPVNASVETCAHGGTGSLAAFLVGAGEYSYYHCQGPTDAFSTNPEWPSVPDMSLDWLPEYDYKLGTPLGPATTQPSKTGANASVWSRQFASGTRVQFDGGNGNGTIWWSNGLLQVSGPTYQDPSVLAKGCAWESVAPDPL
jgi:hypothetical protein